MITRCTSSEHLVNTKWTLSEFYVGIKLILYEFEVNTLWIVGKSWDTTQDTLDCNGHSTALHQRVCSGAGGKGRSYSTLD